VKLRALIVDDEPLAREGVRELLRNEDGVEIVGECSDGIQAIEEIERLTPDLLFLDVQMPELNGFDVVESLDVHRLPAVVFVTAYDEYALRAFDIHAVDYLLKPLDPKRFREALARVKEWAAHRNGPQVNQNLQLLLEDIKRQRGYVSRFIVKSLGRIRVVTVSDIDWIGAEGDYACLHTKGKSHLFRETMNALEQQLDPARFLRIHRSTIVNIDRVKELQPLAHGEYALLLDTGTRLSSSRSHRRNLDRLLKTSG